MEASVAVITTMPLDEQMAEFVRGVVQAEIGFLAVGSIWLAGCALYGVWF